MKIVIIGASGFVGAALLNEALGRDHIVTAVARSAAKIKVTHANLTVKECDVFHTGELASVLEGHDAVISAFNPGWDDPQIYAHFLKGSNAIVEAVKKAGIKRLLMVGGAGSLYNADGKQLVDSPGFPAEWKQGALAARDFLNALRLETDLEWTFLSPAIILKPGERTGKFRIGRDNPVLDENGECTVTVGDLAAALFDELDNRDYIRKRFTVGY